MDNISEQLVKINKTPKDYFLLGGIWVAAFFIVFLFVLLGFKMPSFFGILILVSAGVMYGAYKLSSLLSIEYEYIVVNRDMDIDKITDRSSRKRIVSIKLNEVEEFGVYSQQKANALANRNFSCRFICCNSGDEAYYLTYNHPKKGMILLILAMNERTKSEAMKTIPRIALSD